MKVDEELKSGNTTYTQPVEDAQKRRLEATRKHEFA